MIRSHLLGYDWQAQMRDCPIARDAKPVAKGVAKPGKTIRIRVEPAEITDRYRLLLAPSE